MDYFWKALITALACAAFALTLKKYVPEISLGIQLAGVMLTAFLAVRLLVPIFDFLKETADVMEVSRVYLLPMLKASVIGVLSGAGGSICKDAGQGGLASVLQVLGCACAIYTALPLLEMFTHTIGELL